MFSQLAKRSSKVSRSDLCTDNAHYVKNQGPKILRSLRRNKNMAVKAGLFFTILFWCFANLLLLCRFSDIVCGFLFLLNNFPLQSLEYATYSISCEKLRRIGTTEELSHESVSQHQLFGSSKTVLLQTS